MRDIVDFLVDNHFISHFERHFKGGRCARDNLRGLKKSLSLIVLKWRNAKNSHSIQFLLAIFARIRENLLVSELLDVNEPNYKSIKQSKIL